jgi:hypothetical protein
MQNYVIDPSSYRIDNTVYYRKEEAVERAAYSANILGRRIGIWEVVHKDINWPSVEPALRFWGYVNPDGSVVEGELPTTNPSFDADIATAASSKFIDFVRKIAEKYSGEISESKTASVVVTFADQGKAEKFVADIKGRGYTTKKVTKEIVQVFETQLSLR